MLKYINILFLILLFNNSLLAREIKKVSNEELSFLLNELYKSNQEDWLGAYVKDQNGNDIKIGYTKIKIERIQNEKKEKFFVLQFYFFLNFKTYGLDSIIETYASEIYQNEPPYNFLHSSSYTVADGIYNTSVTTLKNNELTYLELDNDKLIQLKNENIEYRLNDIFSFETLVIKDQLKVGDIFYTKALDNNEIVFEKNTVLEINNVGIDGVSQKYYKINATLVIDGEETETIMYGNAEQIISFNMDLGDGFVVNLRLESKQEATDLSYIADLYILNSIHLDENFHTKNIFDDILEISQNESSYLNYLNFEITGEFNGSVDENYINQKIIKQNSQVFLNLGYNYDFDLETVSNKYYDEAYNYKLDHPELNAIATEAINNPKDGYDEINQLMTWIYENTYKFAELEEITDPYEILNRGGGDCTEITDLFNSLAKSIGIPARSVRGYAFGFEDYSFGGHQWSEIEIDGRWVPVDATWNMWVESSPFHIKEKGMDNVSKGLTKKFKLNLKEVQFSNGKIIKYNQNGTKKTIN